MESFEYGFVYNWVGLQSIFAAFFQQYAQFLHKFLARAREFGQKMQSSIFRGFLPINVPKRYWGKIMFYDDKLSRTREAYYLESWLYSSKTDIVEAMNTLIQKRNNHRVTCITFEVSRVTQKIKVYLTNEEASLAVFSTDSGHIFGGDVRDDLGIVMCGKGSLEPPFAYDIVRFHSLMIYTDIAEYNNVGDSKTPLLHRFPFISKLKSGVITTTGQYMNYQTFSNLQFRQLLRNSSHSKHIDLRDTSSEMIPFVSLG